MVRVFIQGKPLAIGYYSRHPETLQYSTGQKTKQTNEQQEKIQKVYIACTIKHLGVIV